MILLSKSDLLGEDDLHQVIRYVQEHLQGELGLHTNVHPVSSLSSHSNLLDQFFERELLPRFDTARILRNESIARKIGAMRETVVAALEMNLNRGERRSQTASMDIEELEQRLRQTTGAIGEQRTTLNHAFLKLGEITGAGAESGCRHRAAVDANQLQGSSHVTATFRVDP